MNSSVTELIKNALLKNKKCSTGLAVQQQVFYLEKGPSGGPELLAKIYADDPVFNYWYGHIVGNPSKKGEFVSLIVSSEIMINANNIPLYFNRFKYWVLERGKYEPCLVQGPDDAYMEASCFKIAADNLAWMINNFDIEKKKTENYSDYSLELRIFDIYGIGGCCDDNGCWPPPPMPHTLKTV